MEDDLEPWAVCQTLLARHVREAAEARAALQIEGGQAEAMGPGVQVASAQSGGVAIIPIRGMILPRVNPVLERFGLGGAGAESIRARVRAMAADQAVSAIVLSIDSPGGLVFGVPELAAEIMTARKIKPVIAVVEHTAASAAYWIASAATQIVASSAALLGSVGVFTRHLDQTKLLEDVGIKLTNIASDERKVELSSNVALSEEARKYQQGMVDALMESFVKSVAKGRGISAAKVRADFGGGRVLLAPDAIAAGMADRIGGLEETVTRLMKQPRKRSRFSAQARVAFGG